MKKSFAWSYSNLAGFETCAYQFYQLRKAKRYKDVEGPELKWGNWVHKQLENHLKLGFPLPEEVAAYQKWADFVKNIPGKMYVEQQYGLTRELKPCGYFDNHVWFRGKGDVVKVNGAVGMVGDWKTGKVKDDPLQLMLMAQCLFANFPELEKVASMFFWLKFDTHTPSVFTKQQLADMWVHLLDRVKAMEEAEIRVQGVDPNDLEGIRKIYSPNPSGLCKRHCVVMDCPFHGKGGR